MAFPDKITKATSEDVSIVLLSAWFDVIIRQQTEIDDLKKRVKALEAKH